MAIRADDVVDVNWITASSAFAVIHELTLLQQDLKFLLIAVDAQHWRTQEDVCDQAE